MHKMLTGEPKTGLEGLCEGGTRAIARISIGPGCSGIERLEARFRATGFSPHRHDTYAIGITLSGVQTFHYRGRARRCLPGQCHVLHPDELHDGVPGAPEGFAYRIAYLDPGLVQAALGGRALPFVSDPVIDLSDRLKSELSVLWDLESPIDDMGRVELVSVVADMLLAASGTAAPPRQPLCLSGLARVRSLVAEHTADRIPIDELERAADLDRWSLARQFRSAFGTSPSRFRTMRQLDRVRRSMRSGAGLADAALAAGFADQSHMSRQFKRAYGLTPARWLAALH